jgi:cell division protease FtsH
MPTGEKKTPLEDFKEKVRALFTPGGIKNKKDALPPKAHFSIWYFLITLLLIAYLQQHFFSPKVETIPYSKFKQNLVAGNVTKLIISP